MTSPNLTNVVWVKTILTNMNVQKSYRHIWPKKVKYPIPKIPDDSEKKIGYGSGIAKNQALIRVWDGTSLLRL